MMEFTWPKRRPDQAVAVLVTARTSTHVIDLTEDGVVSIQRNELRDMTQDPEIMQETEGAANYNVLNQENIDALLSVLTAAKQRYAS